MFAANVKGQLASWWRRLLASGPNLALAALAVFIIQSEFPRTLPDHELRDFGSFVASGRAARDGLNPYGIYPPLTFRVVAPGFETWNQNLNPPISGLLFQLFSMAEPHTMFRIWYVITIALYAIVIFLLIRRYREAPRAVFVLWACALPGLWDTLHLGQIYIPLVLATVVAWLLLDRGRSGWAGVLIGAVVAVKPNFAVWPALLFLSGYYRPAVISGLVAVLISAVPAVVLGPQVYAQWFELIASDASRAVFLTNVSLNGLAARAGLPLLGMVLAVGALAGSAAWAWWRRRDVMDLSAFALLIALLASPVAWVHYTLFLLPIICAKWRARGMWFAAALSMVTIPFITRQLGEPVDVQLTLGSVYTWAVLALLAVLVSDQFRKSTPQTADGDQLTAGPSAVRREVREAPRPGPQSTAWAPRGQAVLLAAFAAAVIATEFVRTLPGDHLLDFGSFVESGQAARRGENPYGVYPLTFRVVIGEYEGVNPNLNPPISALLLQGFGFTEPHRMFRIWYCVNLALYAAVIILLLRRYKETPRVLFVVSACAMAGLWETLVLGQIYLPLVLAAVGAWLLLEHRWEVAAGILIGFVIAVKPNFLVWPALLFCSGRFRASFVCIATAVILSALPALVLGPEVYRQWFELLAVDKGRAVFPTNASLAGLAERAGLPFLGTVASLLLLGLAAVWAFFRRPSIQQISAAALLLSVLASPIGWVNYTLFLLPVFCWKWSSPIVQLVVACLIVPVTFVIAAVNRPPLVLLTRGSLYNWALLLLLGWFVAEQLRKHGLFSRSEAPLSDGARPTAAG